ncbi:LysR substrate-binding domain-containing protein [Glaciimonas sp. PCH181]|uniref:LysR substrate-binding domain-containing protein n=1 Tax=Glaciimonas sp. PCH181 TaxID=2133943 RepID=UPI000D398D92|nr:LysR substrate-binding domain-containing protein [Glaciimonas sp. PCH181]PUA20381.1 LysR family transcriptional regulator [Glaciimonas sp. PCH181]
MRRKLPSTAALTMFEAAARHQSFTHAGAELSITQSAVCRQIDSLEEFLGVKLFRRSRRGVLLTNAGERYSKTVRATLDAMERDTLSFMANGGASSALELAVVPTFATRWLVPRLARFQQAHPGITVHLTPQTRPFMFSDTAFDAALLAGGAGWPGTGARLLLHETLIAVCSPSLVPDCTMTPAQMALLPLLQQGTRPYVWRQWFSSLNLSVERDVVGARMELFSMLIEAAIHGLGAALVPRFLVEAELADGRLVEPVRHSLASDRSYYFIYPEHKADDPVLTAFLQWIIHEAERYREEAGNR